MVGDDDGGASSVSGITPTSDYNHEESKVRENTSGSSEKKKSKPMEFAPVMKMLK